MFGIPSCMLGCLPYVWTCPDMFGHPHVCLDAPICLDNFQYVWILPIYVWMHPLYVWIAPFIFGCPPICLDTLQYVWMAYMDICNTNKTCFVRLRRYPYAPIDLDAPICLDTLNMFGCTLIYFDAPPVCLDAPYVWITSYMF